MTTIFCAGLLAVTTNKGCTNVHPLEEGGYATKYILILGNGGDQRVSYRDRVKFEKALMDYASWYTQIKVNDPDGVPAKDIDKKDPDPGATPSAKIARITIGQSKHSSNSETPCTLHVTQKIGLNNLRQMKKVLDELNDD